VRVSVAYAEPEHQQWLELDVPEGTTAERAVRLSGILERFPHLTLEDKELGIFSKPVPPDRVLREGDRVEVYRPLKADPKKARVRQGPPASGRAGRYPGEGPGRGDGEGPGDGPGAGGESGSGDGSGPGGEPGAGD